jgi:hypothetical protein
MITIALILSSSFSKVIEKASLQTLRGEYKPKMPSSITDSAKLVEGKKNRISCRSS